VKWQDMTPDEIANAVGRLTTPVDWDHFFEHSGLTKRKRFWISVRRAKDCIFSRRNGYYGVRLFGWSICVRLFGVDIL
jgi:hypothetical protein